MKIFKTLLKIIFFIYPNLLFSVTYNKSDLNFLNINDKKKFLDKCLEKENFKYKPRCLNFLGLKNLSHF